jgi:hypothetical protein
VIEIEETFAPPPVRPHVVKELFDDPPVRIKQEDEEDLPVEVANSDDGSCSLAVLVVPSFEVEAKEPSERADGRCCCSIRRLQCKASTQVICSSRLHYLVRT